MLSALQACGTAAAGMVACAAPDLAAHGAVYAGASRGVGGMPSGPLQEVSIGNRVHCVMCGLINMQQLDSVFELSCSYIVGKPAAQGHNPDK